MTKRIWVVGASARAIAQSFERAGYEVAAADLFCDADLAQIVGPRLQRIEQFPHDLARLIDDVNADAWVYAGGLENYPELVDELAARLPLLGNSGDVLRQVRDPRLLEPLVREAGLAMPEMRFDAPSGSAWLRKSMRSSGGLRVRRATTNEPPLHSDEYYQQFIEGQSLGASFLGDGPRTQLLGVCQQLVDAPWTNAPEFHYAGSIGPVSLSPEQLRAIERLGILLAERTGLRGWFGIDLIRRAGFQPASLTVLEVNPRFTASIELLERSRATSSAPLHVAACLCEPPPAWSEPGEVWGKAILYAEDRVSISPDDAACLLASSRAGTMADIPSIGEIPAGSPILTLLARGSSVEQVQTELYRQSESVRRRW